MSPNGFHHEENVTGHWRVRKDLQIETRKTKQMDREAINSRRNKNVFKNLIIVYYLTHQ